MSLLEIWITIFIGWIGICYISDQFTGVVFKKSHIMLWVIESTIVATAITFLSYIF